MADALSSLTEFLVERGQGQIQVGDEPLIAIHSPKGVDLFLRLSDGRRRKRDDTWIAIIDCRELRHRFGRFATSLWSTDKDVPVGFRPNDALQVLIEECG